MNLVTKKVDTLREELRYFRGINLHYDHKTVYWIEYPSDSINILSSVYDGSGEKMIARGVSKSYMLGIYRDLLYFEKNGYINEMNASNGNIFRYIPVEKTDYNQLIIVDGSRQPTGEK